MRIFKIVAIILLLVACGAAARGDSPKPTVQMLLKACTSPAGSGYMGFCNGMVKGVGDTLLLIASARKVMKDEQDGKLLARFAMCTDAPVSYGAMEQAFVNWAKAHPESWNQPMSVGLTAALNGTWPCSVPDSN